jgi:decaprenylphospho-beta-D-ribofuranose 2-oxidase
MQLSNWGQYPKVNTTMHFIRSDEHARHLLSSNPSCIARGLGRCYGDSSLNDQSVLSTTWCDHMIDFDPSTGEIACEAGISLKTLLRIFVPRGWFLPVTPGTKLVTIGGAVASDVHGKNHHVAGTFCRHVLWIDLLCSDGNILRCSPNEYPELFQATCGGLGLTGIILRVAFRLISISTAYIHQETVKARNLEEIMACFDQSAHWRYSVAWIDCLQTGDGLGRSIMIRGEHANIEDLDMTRSRSPLISPEKFSFAVPINLPRFTLNNWSVKAFNAIYHGRHPEGTTCQIVDLDSFFYPLDAIQEWNRIYGKRGFLQYQCVIPRAAALEGLTHILDRIASSGMGSFLAVLKLFGPQEENGGILSFPRKGYTLALDFPVKHQAFSLLDELDALVLDFGGRHYLTKDARMSRATFERSYATSIDRFRKIKTKWDPSHRFISLQSQRLGIGG